MVAPRIAPGTAATARAAVLAGLVALIVLGLAWELWLAPTGQRTLAIKVLPLLLALPGLLQDRLRTYRWLSLSIWLWFIEGVVRATGDRGASDVLAAIEVGLCLAVFAACLARVRAAPASPAAGA